MGRQAYLAKLAFGRSAFEPTREITQSDEYIQLESSQGELPRQYQEFNGNNYVQLYDERGNPINPRSREYGKSLRNAQNDVLAAVGVVERRRSPSEGLPGPYEGRLEELDVEDTVGSVLGATFTLTENLCTWWIGSIRDRVLTFRYHDAMPFARVVASEYTVSGSSIIYASFVPRIFATLCTQTVLYNTLVYKPLARLLYVTRASSKIRKLYRLSKDAMEFGLRLGLEILFYPFYYHANLQRLGLIPARPLLPHWRSVVPFSRTSPITPFSLYYKPTTSIVDCAKAAFTSPMVLVCVEHFFERWAYATINEAVDASVIRPDNPDIVSPEAGNRHQVTTILGLRRQSPTIVRTTINKFLSALGWGTPFRSGGAHQCHVSRSAQTFDSTGEQTIDVGGTTVTNITPLELAVAQTRDQQVVESSDTEVFAIQATASDDIERPVTPITPLASHLQYDDDDPRIRITNREGIVEMEVRLPPRILSTHTEVADALASTQIERALGSQHEATTPSNGPHHRVSQLSLEPPQMISAVVKAQLVGLAVLPLKLVVLRLIASHYLASDGGDLNASRIVAHLPGAKDLSWKSVGIHVSRLALCRAFEIAIDLSLWGLQYAVSLNIGRNLFDWGTL